MRNMLAVYARAYGGRSLTIAVFTIIGGLLGGYLLTHYGQGLWNSYPPIYPQSLGTLLLGSLLR